MLQGFSGLENVPIRPRLVVDLSGSIDDERESAAQKEEGGGGGGGELRCRGVAEERE